MSPTRLSFLSLVSAAQIIFSQKTLGCIEVYEFSDIRRAVQFSKTNSILLCPFSISHDLSDNESSISIDKEGTRLICSKHRLGDKCELFGTARHIDIVADDVTLFGFDVIGSVDGSISVQGGRGATFLDCNFRSNERIPTGSEDGGSIAIATDEDRNALVYGSYFEGNAARNGGAIFGSGVTIVSSVFRNNVAYETYGGAAFVKSGYIRSSNFTSNDAEKSGPTVYSDHSVCDAGLNYACHLQFYQNNTCDGISSKEGRCVEFGSTCEYDSNTPSIAPTEVPSEHPSMLPSSQPSFHPTSQPSSFPSVTDIYPSTKAPSRIPVSIPKHVPSHYPIPSRGISSKSPTVTQTIQPYIPSHPTTCNMDTSQKNQHIHIYLPGVNDTSTGPLQSEVMKWLLTIDTFSYCPREDIIIQRYAAALISKTFSPDIELTHVHECNWDGFFCNQENQIVSFVKSGTRHRLPKELSMLVNLRHVLVKKGEITGTIPPPIFELSSLKRLDLDKNDMSGVIQVNVDSDIQRLDVNFNKFSGSIDFLQSFPNITEAHLDNNNFSGEIPASLGQLKNLHILTLHGNELRGTMPQSICELRRHHNLKYLMADCDGPSPKVFCDCCTHCSPY